MEYENLVCERRGAALVVRLNRPEKLNSLSQGMLGDLRACAESIQRDASVRAVVLTGAGRGFCAGADLTDPDAAPAAGQTMGQWIAQRMRADFNPVAVLWSSLPAPLLVAVNGVAAGAGVSLALLGDITLAARSASFSVLFTPKLGLAPEARAMELAELLGAGPTRALLAVRALTEDGATRALTEQLEREAAVQQTLADTGDFSEGIAAFREKRAPRFRGS
jgi:2-(1,2-epoxy-1,2-dihydrophenyl)acetyl-CoA isomerase